MSSSNTQTTEQHMLLKNIRPKMRQLDIKVIVLQQEGEPVNTRDISIVKFMVADATGVMQLNVWGEPADYIRSGDILRITGVESRYRLGQHHLATTRQGKIQRLGQDTFSFAEGPNFSEPEQGANIPSSKITGQAVGPNVNQPPSSKHHQQQQTYTNNAYPATAGPSLSSAKLTSMNNRLPATSGTTRQSYMNNNGPQHSNQHHSWQHRNHGDGWQGDGGVIREMGRSMGRGPGNGEEYRRSGNSAMEGTGTHRDPRKRNFDNPSTSILTKNNGDSRATRQKVSYNEFTP
ncbi:hypothetical protein BCR42DRAFT_405769 [Absidia repens]|uniref:OB domain-containing protein n=1 Tax=Absidia repens TaxID=90262 RepID=A0A1X2ITW9_9FUNG|nr:hypothetical protein BCR42DRAFT_405769 [Absidia repens]